MIKELGVNTVNITLILYFCLLFLFGNAKHEAFKHTNNKLYVAI